MLTLTEIFTILIIHWIADFVFQDEKWALGKSKNWSDLLLHTFTYSFIFFWGIAFLILYINGRSEDNFWLSLCFALITFIAHTITDYITSRIVSKKFENKHYGSAIPNFGAFTIIGIDQILHYIQLFLTYYYLKELT
jgi:hypothetical protein